MNPFFRVFHRKINISMGLLFINSNLKLLLLINTMSEEIVFDCLHAEIVNYCLYGNKVINTPLHWNFLDYLSFGFFLGKRFLHPRIHRIHNGISSH